MKLSLKFQISWSLLIVILIVKRASSSVLYLRWTGRLITCDLVIWTQMVWIISLFLLKHSYIIIWNGFPLLSHGQFLCCRQIFKIADVSSLDI